MFDANMRYLPKGMEFFAEIRWLREDHPLTDLFKGSKIVLCTMLSKESKDPSVTFHLPDNSTVTLAYKECGRKSWIVYAGQAAGKDFLTQFPEVRVSAKKYLEEHYPEKLKLWEDDGK